MKYVVTINNNNYEVDVEREKATVVKTGVATAPTAAVQTAAQPVAAPATAAPSAPAAAQTVDGEHISAPMPGLILQIKKNTGDSIKKGDVLFVLEAMKMENEIYSPKDGTMGQIFTTVGTNVVTGTPLAAIR